MTRSWWGWGDEESQVGGEELAGLGSLLAGRFDLDPREPLDPGPAPRAPEPRLRLPAPLAEWASTDPTDRTRHARGNAFRDVVRAVEHRIARWPDAVVRPHDAAGVAEVLEFCAGAGAVCIPFGGGTSVVGGVNPPDDDRPLVSLDLERLDRVLEVDAVSLSAHVQGGALGPRIEDQLRPHGLTFRHFPQSWEFSSLGGWIATRAGGHFATGPTHIDDLVESVTAITPRGEWSSRRLPASGAGPSPDRFLLGSEGALGVVTDAWVRVRRRPVFRSQATVEFPDFTAGAAAVRSLAQSELRPANCRLLDPAEAALNGAGDGNAAVLVLGFESADHPLHPWMDRALELCADHRGDCPAGPEHVEGDRTGTSTEGAGSWRRSFLRAPYLRDALVRLGMVVETFESACTWDRFDDFVDAVAGSVRAVAVDVLGDALVTVRITHAYPDGAAPYFTVIGPGRSGGRVAQWDEIKQAAGEAILAQGGTITHHHAVGRDHVPWYARQRPQPFGAALAAVKRELDPGRILNPGVLGL